MDTPNWFTSEIRTLLTAGVFGSIVRVLIRPEKQWQRWLVQVFIGTFSAVFLGSLVGHVIISVVGEGSSNAAYLASGFLIGTAAEKVIEKLQNKFL